MSKSILRTIAIHLPQFHPTPENDAWWGKGFTEWTNVTKAEPLFNGHYQPHLPADLGFYDLRLEQSRADQAELAKQYGIDGFCYYHYWFNSKRILNEPVDRILALKKPDFPFMLCWANENWTRRWDGQDQDILMEQKYSDSDDIDHINWLCKNAFSDKRYITVDGAPVFAVYRPMIFPNIKKTIQIWREEAAKLGFPKIYLCGVQSMGSGYINPDELGFDAAIEFQPDWEQLQKTDLWSRFKYKFGLANGKPVIFDYEKISQKMMARKEPNFKQYPCITPSWDNSARKKHHAIILHNSTPKLYGTWFKNVLKKFKPFSKEENFVFINAWNEWAEGNHLEPDRKWGLGYLEATKEALDNR
jgi:lipopolysaccharide biosynthesis protein